MYLEVYASSVQADLFIIIVTSYNPLIPHRHLPVHLQMLSSSLRSLRSTVCRVQGRRFASHETPQYNEPSGYLFGEKVPI